MNNAITITAIDAINCEHNAATIAAAKAVDHAMRAGDLLLQAKEALPHGAFTQWLDEHFHGSSRTARAYMQLARQRDVIEAKRQNSAISSIDEAMRLIASPRLKDETLLAEQEKVVDANLDDALKVHHAVEKIAAFTGRSLQSVADEYGCGENLDVMVDFVAAIRGAS